MTKKQLLKQIILLDNNLRVYRSFANKELVNLEKKISSYNKKQDERWEMLKDYLKVEEEDYAELQAKVHLSMPFISESKPVKKTKLVKINKSKK